MSISVVQRVTYAAAASHTPSPFVFIPVAAGNTRVGVISVRG